MACDAEGGGRLIYYDFGMMDELSPNVREGLVNLIFGVYENETKEVGAVDELNIHTYIHTYLHPYACTFFHIASFKNEYNHIMTTLTVHTCGDRYATRWSRSRC